MVPRNSRLKYHTIVINLVASTSYHSCLEACETLRRKHCCRLSRQAAGEQVHSFYTWSGQLPPLPQRPLCYIGTILPPATFPAPAPAIGPATTANATATKPTGGYLSTMVGITLLPLTKLAPLLLRPPCRQPRDSFCS